MYTALYKPGSDVIDGYKAKCLIVADQYIDAHLADGWVKTLAETVAPVTPIDDVSLTDEGNMQPTREALEVKAAAHGIKVDGRWSSTRLADEIAKAAK